MCTDEDQVLERYIRDWYWDEKSHQFARALGRYLFQFMEHLAQQGLTQRTLRKHHDNCWCIGSLECQYGDRGEFSPGKVFAYPEANYEILFMHKISDAESAVASYCTTWRKLYKYTRALGYLDDDA